MDRGRILLEGPLDDIRSSFRRLIVTGTALPTTNPSILSIKQQPHATQYILQHSPDAFAQNLLANGATIVESNPMSLNEIFIELCRTSESTAADREEEFA